MKVPFDFYEKVFAAFFLIVLALTAGSIFGDDLIPVYVFEAWTQMLYVVIPTTAGYEGFKMRESRRSQINTTTGTSQEPKDLKNLEKEGNYEK